MLFTFMASLTWDCVTITTAKVKNAAYDIVLTSFELLEELLNEAGIQFAPALYDILCSEIAPTITQLKSLPSNFKRRWAVYLLILEKLGHRPKVYVGSGTNKTAGVSLRMYSYDSHTNLPVYVEQALNDGYAITSKGLLCWAPIPKLANVYLYRLAFLALESMFASVLWAMRSRKKDYGVPILCPWSIEDLAYDGLCSHTALMEGIKGKQDDLTDDFTPAEITVKIEECRAWKRQVDKKHSAATKRKAIDSKKYYCKVCRQASNSQWQLDRHNATKLHRKKASGNTKLSPMLVWERRNIATRKFVCVTCDDRAFGSKQKQRVHLASQAHKDRVAKAALSQSSSRST
jgi:hypothetical protein